MPQAQFLGTMAGTQTLTYSSIKKTFTYTRVYEGSEIYDRVRSDLYRGCFVNLPPGNQPLSPASYAISQYGQAIEYISGLSLSVLQAQTDAYSIQYMIYHYFDSVIQPQEGDLIFYSNPEDKLKMTPLVGIFKNTCDIFLNPEFYGNIATFYRLKTQPVSFELQYSIPLNIQPIPYNILGDLFICDTSIDIRSRLRFSKTPAHLMWKFEEIQMLDYIQFKGVCFDYAFGKFLETYFTPNYRKVLSSRKILSKYFDTTIHPEKGDLAVYYCDLKNAPDHYGIYIKENWIESKWGDRQVCRHDYFNTPHIYGDYLRFIKLKPGLSKKWFYFNIKLDQEGRDPNEPIIVNQDAHGYKTLLSFSYRKPKEPGLNRGFTPRPKPFRA